MSWAPNMRDRLITGDTTLTTEDDLIKANTSSNAISVTLPDSAAYGVNRSLLITKITGDQNALSVIPAGSDTINAGEFVSLASTSPFATARLISDGAGDWTLALFSIVPVVGRAQQGFLVASVAAFDGGRTLADFTVSGNSDARGVPDVGAFRDLRSASGNGAEVGWEVDDDIFAWDSSPTLDAKGRLVSVTSMRFFCGLVSGSLSNAVSADDPTQAHVGFRYSPDTASDANIKFVVDNGTTQVVVASTVTPLATDVFFFVVRVLDSLGTVLLEIRNVNHDILDSHSFSTGLPAGSTLLRPVGGMEKTQAAGAGREVDWYNIDVDAVGS